MTDTSFLDAAKEQELEAGITTDAPVETHHEDPTGSDKPTIETDGSDGYLEEVSAGADDVKLPDIESYFDWEKGRFWIKNSRGSWITAKEGNMKRELRKMGYSTTVKKGKRLSEVDEKISEIHLERDVAFAGRIAGYDTGILEGQNGRMLVTQGPKLIKPSKGEWPTIKELTQSLFKDHNQIDYVYGWLQVGIKSLMSGKFGTGQALVIAGERGNGKSCFQELIITPILGGRSALPYRYLSGVTQFNGELIEAEHLMIGDEVVPDTGWKARRAFGARIKDIVANESQSCHPKNYQAIRVKPFWRLSITLNDETENLLILPPLDESLADKITMLKSSKATNLPNQDEREAFRDKIESEMPAFAHFLLNEFVIPDEIASSRYGVEHFHHPDLVEALDELLPELQLHNIVREVLFSSPTCEGEYRMSASELEKKLLASDFEREVAKILYFPNACGTMLSRLASKHGNTKSMYERRKSDGKHVWIIREKPVVYTNEVPS